MNFSVNYWGERLQKSMSGKFTFINYDIRKGLDTLKCFFSWIFLCMLHFYYPVSVHTEKQSVDIGHWKKSSSFNIVFFFLCECIKDTLLLPRRNALIQMLQNSKSIKYYFFAKRNSNRRWIKNRCCNKSHTFFTSFTIRWHNLNEDYESYIFCGAAENNIISNNRIAPAANFSVYPFMITAKHRNISTRNFLLISSDYG